MASPKNFGRIETRRAPGGHEAGCEADEGDDGSGLDERDRIARTHAEEQGCDERGRPDADRKSARDAGADDDGCLTITTAGKDAKGQNIDSVAVYDKQ